MKYDRNKIIGGNSKCYYPVGNKIWLCVVDNFGGCLREDIHEDEWYYMCDYKKGLVSDEGWEDIKKVIDEYFENEKMENKMTDEIINMYDFNGEFSQTYTEECKCGNKIEISTQTDEEPEYYTDIYVKCKCGKSVGFLLPVN